MVIADVTGIEADILRLIKIGLKIIIQKHQYNSNC